MYVEVNMKVGDLVRYWHPRKGGWYHGYLEYIGRKWARVNGKRMPVTTLKEEYK